MTGDVPVSFFTISGKIFVWIRNENGHTGKKSNTVNCPFSLLWLPKSDSTITQTLAKVAPKMCYLFLEFPVSTVCTVMLWCVCVSYFSFSLFGLLRRVVSGTLSCFSYPRGLGLNNWVVLRQGNKLHCRCNNLLDNVCVSVWVLCLCVVMTAITPGPGKQTHAV